MKTVVWLLTNCKVLKQTSSVIILHFFKHLFWNTFYQTVLKACQFHFREEFIFMFNAKHPVTHPSSGTECRTVRHSFSTCSTFRSSSGKSPSSCIRAESPLFNCDIRNSSRSSGSTASYDWGCRTKGWWRKGRFRTCSNKYHMRYRWRLIFA